MRTVWIALAWSLLLTLGGLRASAQARGVDFYFIDVEGGAATLIVSPQGESALIDCGNPGARDAERIVRVAGQVAGLKAIDHLFLTHWHLDHYGGVEHLSELLPIRHFYDRGIPDSLQDDPQNFPTLIAAYKKASEGKAGTLKPGDEIKLSSPGSPDLRILCVASAGEVLSDRSQTANPLAKEFTPKVIPPSDNDMSMGFLVSFAGFKFLDLGDLTWNVEAKLVIPTDKLGKVDVFQSTHHGLEVSNNPVMIKTVSPRVAIFNNGARKGGHPDVTKTLRGLPEIKAIYQMHRNLMVGPELNTKPEFIANMEENCQAEFIHLAVAPDGRTYTVQIGSKGKARRYPTRNTTPEPVRN